MNNQFWKKNSGTLFFIAAATAVICLVTMAFYRPEAFIGAIGRMMSILTPFVYGLVIAYLLRPMSVRIDAWLRRIGKKKNTGSRGGWQRTVAALISVLVLLVGAVIILLLILPQLVTSISSIISSLPDAVERFQVWLEHLAKGKTSTAAAGYINNMVTTITERLEDFLRTSLLPSMQSVITDVTSSFMDLIGVLANFGLGCIISIYLLCSWEQFVRQVKLILYCILPKKGADWIWNELHFADQMFNGFIVGKIVDSLIMGLRCFVFSVLFRFPYAALISVVIGVTNVIPFFGPYLGVIPSVVLILTVSPLKALWFLVFIIILQQVDGNVIGPRIIGNRLGISSFWILFSILFFGAVWGLPGMLAGAPVFAVLYDLITRGVTRGLEMRGLKKMRDEYVEEFHEKEPEQKPAVTPSEKKEGKNRKR